MIFFNKNNIYDPLYYICDNSIYELLDESLVCDLLNTIKILIKGESLNFNEYLVLSDFIHGICNKKTINTDPAFIVFKTTRESFLYYISMRAIINTTFGYNVEAYIKIHKKLLIATRIDNIIERSIIRTHDGNNWNTIIYNMLITVNTKKVIKDAPSKVPYILVMDDKYIASNFRNIMEVKHKKKEMESFNIDLTGLKKSNSIPYIFDKNLFEINKDFLNQNLKELLNECKVNTIEEYFNLLIIKLKNKKYFNKHNKNIKEDNYLINFNKILVYTYLYSDIFEKKFYLPCFIDNRGRQYYATFISPTFSKLMRYLYKFYEKKDFVNLEKSIFFKKILKYKHTVIQYNLDDKNSYLLIVLLIEIGKFFKKTQECFTNIETFIKLGLENFEKSTVDGEDNMYLNTIRFCIKNLINKKDFDYNILIYKDATASGLQNRGIINGYKTETLKYLNLSGDSWCDTYQYIVNLFILDEKYKNRKFWKKTIMTIVYNAKWYTCFYDFVSMLRNSNIEYKEFSELEKENLKKMHLDFYKKINSEDFLKIFFLTKENNNTFEFKYNKWEIINQKEYKINYKNFRDKYIDIEYKITEDKEKTKLAFYANNLHYYDAELVREILKNLEVISIHDCFGVRLCELHILMDVVNNYYSKYHKSDNYSIFILK